MSKKKELVAAIKSVNAGELWKCLTESSFFTYESFHTNTPTKIWIGDFLFDLRDKNKITEEELLWTLTAQNIRGENWLHTLARDSIENIIALFGLLHALAKGKLVAFNKLLQLLFLTQIDNFSFAMLIAKRDKVCTHHLIEFLKYLGENIATNDFATSIEINFKHSAGGNTLCHMLAQSDNGNEPTAFASFFRFCLTRTIISGTQFLAIVSIFNLEHQSVLDIIATNKNQLGFTEICKVLAFAHELYPLILTDILKLLAHKSQDTSLIEKLFTTDQTQNAIIFPILQKMLDPETPCFPQILQVFLPLALIWRPTDDNTWFKALYSKLLTDLHSHLERNTMSEISFLKTFFLGENGIQHLFMIARSTKDLMRQVIMVTERLIFYEEHKATLNQANVDEGAIKKLLADFLGRLLFASRSFWTIFDIMARYQDDIVNYAFLGFISTLINKMKTILHNQATGKEGHELTAIKEKTKKLQSFIEQRIIFEEGKPNYIQLLIKQKNFSTLQRFLEIAEPNIFDNRELIKQVLFILEKFFPVEFESTNHHKNWIESFIIRLVEKLYTYRQTLDSAELECLSLLAEKGFSCANYFLYRTSNNQKKQLYFQKVSSSYPMLLIDQSLQELQSRFSTKTIIISLCRAHENVENFNDCISKYRDLHYLTDHEFFLLLENAATYYGPVVQFHSGLLYHTQNKFELAFSRFDCIPINKITLSANQHSQLTRIYFNMFNRSKDFKYLYIAVRHGLLASKCPVPISLEDLLAPVLEEHIFIGLMISWITSDDSLDSAFEKISFVIIKELNKAPKDKELNEASEDKELNKASEDRAKMIKLCQLVTEWSTCPVIKKIEDEVNGYIATELKNTKGGLSSFFSSSPDLVVALKQLLDALKAKSQLLSESRQNHYGGRK